MTTVEPIEQFEKVLLEYGLAAQTFQVRQLTREQLIQKMAAACALYQQALDRIDELEDLIRELGEGG